MVKLHEIQELGMKKIKAASAIFRSGECLFLVCDDSFSLFELSPEKKWIEHPCELAPQLPNSPSELKKMKPDLESIHASFNQQEIFYCLPSFSKSNRHIGTKFDCSTNRLQLHDFSELGNQLTKVVSNINIEGSLVLDQELILLNRGAADSPTLLIFLDPSTFRFLRIRNLSFPNIANFPAHGTELFYHQQQIYILFAAEQSVNSYDDGAILGSGIAILDPTSFNIKSSFLFDRKIKAEGLNHLGDQFLICTDPDGEGFSQFFRFEL